MNPTPTDTSLGTLIALLIGLVVTIKLAGAIGFWWLSYIFGNKLADLLDREDDGDPDRSRPAQERNSS